MSKESHRAVSEIVETYRTRYPETERPALRKLILLEHKEINSRTLDRHLKKAFPKFEGKIKESKKTVQLESIFYVPWKEHALQELSRIRNMVTSRRDDDLIQAPEAALLCLRTVLPEKLKQQIKPEITRLERLIEFAHKKTTSNIIRYTKRRHMHLIAITIEVLPRILERAYTLIHEA